MIKLTYLVKHIGMPTCNKNFNDFLGKIDSFYEKEKFDFDDITYYSFFTKGIEIGVLDNQIVQIHCFLFPKDDYLICELDFDIESDSLLEKNAGKANIGNLNRWEMYKYKDILVRFEFDINDRVVLVSLFSQERIL